MTWNLETVEILGFSSQSGLKFVLEMNEGGEENDFVDEIRRLRNQIYGGCTNSSKSGDVVKEEVRKMSPSSEEERTRLRKYLDEEVIVSQKTKREKKKDHAYEKKCFT